MSNKRDNCVDIQLSKGHPIKFLEFCSEFIGSLKLYLQEQKKLTTIFNGANCYSSGNSFNATKSKSCSQVSNNGSFIPSGFYDFQLKTNINFCKSIGTKTNMNMDF